MMTRTHPLLSSFADHPAQISYVEICHMVLLYRLLGIEFTFLVSKVIFFWSIIDRNWLLCSVAVLLNWTEERMCRCATLWRNLSDTEAHSVTFEVHIWIQLLMAQKMLPSTACCMLQVTDLHCGCHEMLDNQLLWVTECIKSRMFICSTILTQRQTPK